MKLSEYKSYDDLPLFLSSPQASYRSPRRKRQSLLTPLRLLSPQSHRAALRGPPFDALTLMHEADFPILKIGNRIVVPKEKFVAWVEQHTKGGDSS